MLDWSFPLFRLFGILIRIHWLLPVWFAVILIQGVLGGYLGFAAMLLAILWGHVLLHEYGHALTAIRLRAGCDTIVLWPLGGAAYCGRSGNLRDDMLITLMGPAVNGLLALAAALALAALGHWHWSLFNPFGGWFGRGLGYGGMALVYTFKLGLILMMFNLLVPAYPLDGGRLLLTWMAHRYGKLAGAKWSTRISIPIGVALLIWGLLQGGLLLVLIALQTLFEAYQIGKMVEQGTVDQHPALADVGWGSFGEPESRPGWFARWRQRRRERAARVRALERAQVQARVDEVLAKISREGMDSLSLDERRILEEASRRPPEP